MATDKLSYIKNFYKFSKTTELTNGAGGAVFGKSCTTVEIYKRRDVSNLNSYLGYMVMLNQRIIIPNANVQVPGPSSSTSYNNYPAILLNQIKISANNGGSIRLHQMFPKTLNTSVSTSSSSNSTNGQSSSQQTTSGSSDTNVNTFGVGLSLGFFGELPVGNLSVDYSHSWENSNFNSKSLDTSSSKESNIGFGDSMSVKDWSSYGYLDDDAISPSWTWGQSYPWDVILYNQSSNGSNINLPQFVINNLLGSTATGGSLVMPPSQLSLFGTDFTMQSAWVVDFPDGVTQDETITLDFITQSFTASHELSANTISATLQSQSHANAATYSSNAIDLSSFSLNPISGAQNGSGAAIGFTVTPFTYPPTSATTPFKIVSPANNVQVTGVGFNPGMTSNFSSPTSVNITFKIADASSDYSLMLMHWIEPLSDACKLSWTINSQYKGTIYVDGQEGTGGQNNMSALELRNTDFTSINFHDYLIVGTNQITIVIEPTDSDQACNYTLFALAIGQAS